MCEVLIVHTSEANEWAKYLQQILVASCNFIEGSILLIDVFDQNLLENQELFDFACVSKCIMPLLSTVFLDMQRDLEVLETFRELLQPPEKVVAFLCGVSESEISADCFEHWDHWRKLSSEDDPSLYVSTVLECINDACVIQHHGQEMKGEIQLEEHKDEFKLSDIPESVTLPDELERHEVNDDDVCPTHEQTYLSTPETQDDQTCLTVQPDRILCGTCIIIYIILVKKFTGEGSVEVEFHSQHSTPKRMPGTLVNECIVTVQSPDMPAGNVSLTLYNNESVICSTTVNYYTEIEEISRYLEKATDPMQFMCQAFDITSNVPDSLDNLLADSLKELMPLNGLQIFGISQIAQENTSANHRDVELPTLLHFSAKYGLKKLTSLLMRCPGALQAYSVMNKDGDYPNKLAEKSGFSDLRQFMDEYVETVDLMKAHMEESQNTPGNEDVYEDMLTTSHNFITSYGESEDIYECMKNLNPNMGLDDDLECVLKNSNPEETMLRNFFGAQPDKCLQSLERNSVNGGYPDMDGDDYHDMGIDPEISGEMEDDLYNVCYSEQIYDTVEPPFSIGPEVLKRPPAPIPRPPSLPEPDNATYISKVFSPKDSVYTLSKKPERDSSLEPVPLVRDRDMSSHHDPFAGMKTPGQRQLISLQERVKVGELTVEEAVQEFKAWQFDQDKRSHSLRFQQENLQRLRNSITRRCRDKGTTDLKITPPMQTNVQWVSHTNINCAVYEHAPRLVTQQPPVSRPLQRGTWQTGSTSSTSSCGSHRLSIQSTVSNSSGADGECEEPPDIPLPPRPSRPIVDTPPVLPPPRVPPRTTERNTESMLNERYVSTPTRPVPLAPPQRPMIPPPLPRRMW
ncbi:phosphoinositide 3-kinase adapter protein 1-like [Xyrauchen texanus]|uniref:phosphoinositide 3-kinase adapter protein 1-like n=1 Tax=Xyrauchen texanus TaxID=154827 RepID=UPI002241BC9E|nr:phosphoinositide 3-kinase adapter protein 1-like [Xyrauchen texanus]XP_051945347.1 phosphoinositide 3-kinase adapter protein 1-like [Xyrauchen texanus]